MAGLLFIGILVLLLFLLIICIGPCLYCRFREDIARMGRGGKDINSEEANSIIYQLKKVAYDPKMYGSDNFCCICREEYVEDAEITILKCND